MAHLIVLVVVLGSVNKLVRTSGNSQTSPRPSLLTMALKASLVQCVDRMNTVVDVEARNWDSKETD